LADEGFARWLAAYTAALSDTSWPACAKLFSEDAVFLPTPFDSPIRGGEAIAAHLRAFWGRFERLKASAEAIAPGWAHWHVAGYLEALEEPFQFDGILNAEFGPDGACTRLVLWTETLSPGETDLLAQRDA